MKIISAYLIKKIVCLVILSVLFSCSSNEVVEQKVITEINNDTIKHIDSTLILNDTITQPKIKEEVLLPITQQAISESGWAMQTNAEVIVYNFWKNNEIHGAILEPTELNTTIIAQWDLKQDTLTVTGSVDTNYYKITKLTNTYLELKTIAGTIKNFFGEPSKRDDGLYDIIYRDVETKPFKEEDIVGEFGFGDSFKFTADGKFIYVEPPCIDEISGTWSMNKNKLSLNFIVNNCNKLKHESNYTILKLSSHWLVLKNSKGNTEARYRY